MAIVGKWWNPKIFVGPYEFSPDLREATLSYGHEVLDATRFGHATKVNMAGLRQITMNCNGFVNLTDNEQEEQNAANVALENEIAVTLMPTNTPAIGDRCYFFQAMQGIYTPGGAVGQLLPYSFDLHSGKSGHPLIKGYVLEPGTTAKTATGGNTGTSKPGTVAAGSYVYGILHVTEVSAGDDITVVIQSDDDVGFGTPTARISFALANAMIGTYAVRVAGPITDHYWRSYHTINGADVSIKYACAVGIASADPSTYPSASVSASVSPSPSPS